MIATLSNGKPRKQLSDELDRLEDQLDRHDRILDALSEGLTGAVQDAATEGTRLAVKDAIVEILTDPALRAMLHQATATSTQPKTDSIWSRLKAKVVQATSKVKSAVSRLFAGATEHTRAARQQAATTWQRAQLFWQFRKVVMLAIGVGATIAAVSYLTSHGVASLISGVGATVTALVVQVGLWARRTAKRFSLS